MWDELSLGGRHELDSRSITKPCIVRMIRHTLEEEIEVINGGDTTINDCPRARVSILICISLLGGIESGIMTFSLLED